MMRIPFSVAAILLAACQPAGTGGAPDRSPVEPGVVAGASAPTTGLDAAIIASMVAAAEELPRLRGILVLRDGESLAEHRFNDGPPLDRAVNIKSASKTVLSVLAGIAIERGVLQGVDQSVVSVLASDAPAKPDPRLATVTVGHLLSMRAGLERTSGQYYGRWVTSPNWVRFALSRPFADEPGGQMLYSTGSSHLLSAMLTRASGRSTHALAQDWLAAPLDIEIPQWPRDPQGVYFGGNDMLMSPEGLARIGELYRNGGRAGEEQVVSQQWIEESWAPRTTSPWSGDAYGYGWFITEVRGHPVRYGRGYGGQMLYVVPDLGLTVVMTSDPDGARDSPHVQALHRLLADGIIPAAEKGG
jgi:CubicO group peptidase (beta-lactamase class C family)